MVKKIIAAAGVSLCILWAVLLIPSSAQMAAPSAAATAGSSASSARSSQTTQSEAPASSSASQTTAPTTASTAAPTTQTTAPTTAAPQPALPAWLQTGYTPQSAYLVVSDGTDGSILYSKGDLDAKIYPASLTKLFTVYVALQHLSPDTEITVGEEVNYVHEDSSRAYIYPGYRLTVSMLVEGMLLPSGNDAAYALAAAAGYAIAGTRDITPRQAIDRFMEEVNATAQALGLTGTHFVAPDGIHHADHYTTPADLMKIVRLAADLPLVQMYAALSQDTVTLLSGQTRTWHNTNALVDPDSDYYCADAVGLKTGYETSARFCLASAFTKNGRTVLVLTLKAPNSDARFADTLWAYYQYGSME